MFKVPNISSGYSKNEIIYAIKRRGYIQGVSATTAVPHARGGYLRAPV